jgi:DNA-directed RNA polymerase specialized sigma24 family protein
MARDDGGRLHDFVAGRYAELRRSAFLMCGDWALADEHTQRSLARLVAEIRRTAVDDPDAFIYSHLMTSFLHRRSRNRQHLFVATPRTAPETTSDTIPPPTNEPIPPFAPPAAARHGSCGVSPTEQPRSRKIAKNRGGEVVGDAEEERDGAAGPRFDPEASAEVERGAEVEVAAGGERGAEVTAGVGRGAGVEVAAGGERGAEVTAGVGRGAGVEVAAGVERGAEVTAEVGRGAEVEVAARGERGAEAEMAAGAERGGLAEARVQSATTGEAGRDAALGDGDDEDEDEALTVGAGDPIRTILVLDALHKLAPRCRAVLILRHWDGFAVDETADMLGLADERVDAYESAGLAALDYLLAEKEPAR